MHQSISCVLPCIFRGWTCLSCVRKHHAELEEGVRVVRRSRRERREEVRVVHALNGLELSL